MIKGATCVSSSLADPDSHRNGTTLRNTAPDFEDSLPLRGMMEYQGHGLVGLVIRNNKGLVGWHVGLRRNCSGGRIGLILPGMSHPGYN